MDPRVVLSYVSTPYIVPEVVSMAPLCARHDDTFKDRTDAGARLADALRPMLAETPREEIVAVGLARGGVIVAAEVAKRLNVRLEAIVVRKLGAPDQPELAVGALTASGERALNQRLLYDIGVDDEMLERIASRAADAAKRLCVELGVPARLPNIEGKTVLLIDDGLATGATMRAAIEAARAGPAGRVIVAVPVAPRASVAHFRDLADDVVAVLTPRDLRSVGQWYRSFGDTPSEEVREVLDRSRGVREL